MILCVQGPRALLGNSQSRVVPLRPSIFAKTDCFNTSSGVWDPNKDLCIITSAFYYLDESGWYWGTITASEAHSLLKAAPEGTFLIRDSSHPLYMLTLSVKTGRGPTNVRIEYSKGRFQLDSSSPARTRMLSFPDVLSLVEHYTSSARGCDSDDECDPVSPPVPKERGLLLKLKRPLRQPEAFPSLQHLARLTINRYTACPAKLPLPKPLLEYLQDYPFQI